MHESHHGLSEAIKIARLEYDTIVETHELAKALNIECASNPCQTVDILYSSSHLEAGKESIQRMRDTMGTDDPAALYEEFSPKEASEMFLCPDSLGAFRYQAGSISAYKFTIGLLKYCLGNGLNLQTNTPALELVGKRDDEERSVVRTPRGDIGAKTVILGHTV
jgi:glycine/D-amino acid oxidase-like deaminating enzyme